MRIKLISPVEHDGKRLEVGESVNLPDRVARELVAAGAAELDGKQKAVSASTDGGEPAKGNGEPSEDPAGDDPAGDQGGQQ